MWEWFQDLSVVRLLCWFAFLSSLAATLAFFATRAELRSARLRLDAIERKLGLVSKPSRSDPSAPQQVATERSDSA